MIHPTAIIDKGAVLGKKVKIGPYANIEDGTEILDVTEIGQGCIIKKGTKIGCSCKIYEYASIGNPPQDINYKGEEINVQIGNGNIIKEFVTIHGGKGSDTIIGDNNFLMS
ncbi:MAG: acyl-[acyl-carrier-protein]--UDP-N-acetylglucosamine O-acyltransferase, partial [Candidatus Stahlbacteria bacterium]|nr:acyl-[acyl-carrier-protein]--UDP-N-acetylglucosamine O-acyltransferase [Candidatus Stahlbacteria bacterium]